MATLKELLAGLDGNSTTVEKTASAVPSKDVTQEVDDILKQIGTTEDELTVEKTANKNEGGDKPMSLYQALQNDWAKESDQVEKTASEAAAAAPAATSTEVQPSAEEIEKTAAISQRTDILGELAADYFNQIAADRFEKLASGTPPDNSAADKGKATGMFGEVGEVRVGTNRPADSEKQIDISPSYYTLDEGSQALVGLCKKKKILEKSLNGGN